jgi:hypothetical protein
MNPKRSELLSSMLLGLAILIIVVAIHESFWWDRGDEARSTALASSVAIVFGLGSMRRPWFFLALIVILDVLRPQVHHSSEHDLLVGGFHLGWLIGMPAGRIQSWLGQPRPGRSDHREA